VKLYYQIFRDVLNIFGFK